MTIKDAIGKLIGRDHLTAEESEQVMQEIMRGEATQAQIGAFLTALRLNGETVDEIAGCAKAMRAHAISVRPAQRTLVDTCGTGGDGANTFNISTTAAFVVAGAGVAVAKHGNRSVSSRCGSADVLSVLGVPLDLPPEAVARCIDEVGIGFLFAPALHPAMKYAIGPRRELGIRTIFNILGPLCNPAAASRQLLGVYDGALTQPLGEVLRALGTEGALVVHGADGLDELSTTGPNTITAVSPDAVETSILDPLDLGLPRARLADLAGGTPEENAGTLRSVLNGKRGPKRDVVLLNAAAALVAGGKADDLVGGLSLAAESVDSGRAAGGLDALIAFTAECKAGASNG
ncbi:MAG: anthranilate phosphoribosyltransferase [Bacteroidetes bacterium]|nr:anthranilate phosphoribosyltransferase [Bacteroidota bacterium]MCL5026221.1 anthranilate phosphoribosyltransferase [Chloroflexota bacterium]